MFICCVCLQTEGVLSRVFWYCETVGEWSGTFVEEEDEQMTSCERYFFTAALIFFSVGMSCDIGVYGLSVMGSNLALNIASKGFNVAVSNRSVERVLLHCCNLICR